MDNDITTHLADALRDCRDHIRATQRITGGEFKADEADAALAAFDAQQAALVAPGDHTPEPWHAVHYTDEPVPCIIGPQGDERIAEMNGNEDPEANARRIIACVNACAGIPTEELEGAGFVPADDETSLFELVRDA